MKLYSALYDHFHPLQDLDKFTELKVVYSSADLDGDGFLIVHGGSDISPSLYGKAVSRRTGATDQPSGRDKVEWALMQEAVKQRIPIFGICRGAQMLCALAGGFLIQHVNNHGGTHTVVTKDGKQFKTNSIHHQMMYPFEVDHEVIAHTEQKLSDKYLDVDTNIEVPLEPEFVHFPAVRGIAVQWHPEMMNSSTPANVYVKEYVDAYRI